MATIKERIWNGSKYVEIDAGTVDGRDSLEFETADPEIQNHIKAPHASVATVNSNRADLDVIKNSGYLKGVDSVAFEDLETIDAQLLGGNAPEYYAAKTQVDSAIGQIQTEIANIDVSWDGVTGKPTTFTPATHAHSEYMPTGNVQAYNNFTNGITNHEQLLWNHGNIIVQSPSTSGTPMISFHSQGATAVGLYEDGCRLYTTGSDGRNSRRLLDTDDYNSLFQSVVNGKQSVVNAINGSVGYASGLTTSNTHDDYAWWIQNKVNSGLNFTSSNIKNFHVASSGDGPKIVLPPTPQHEFSAYWNKPAVVVSAAAGLYMIDLNHNNPATVVANPDIKWAKPLMGSPNSYMGILYVRNSTSIGFTCDPNYGSSVYVRIFNIFS